VAAAAEVDHRRRADVAGEVLIGAARLRAVDADRLVLEKEAERVERMLRPGEDLEALAPEVPDLLRRRSPIGRAAHRPAQVEHTWPR
jgi:hypothetical protein